MKKPVPKKALARVGDPYVTADGKQIRPLNAKNGKEIDTTPIGTIDPRHFKVKRKRTLKDLPAPSNIMHGIAAVFMYTIWGIGDREIAVTLKCDVADIKSLRDHPAYSELFEAVSSAFVDANSDLISARIAAMSHDALSSINDIAVNGQKEADKLRASQDIMNRGGHISEAMQGRNGMSALRILIVENAKAVGIELNPDDLGSNQN